MTASSSAPSDGFLRPKERLEERREEGEGDLKKELDELLLFRAEVMICSVVDVGRLLLPPVSPSLTGDTDVPESVALNL
jgi:hypothetical protein